jgi:hypothetical protein
MEERRSASVQGRSRRAWRERASGASFTRRASESTGPGGRRSDAAAAICGASPTREARRFASRESPLPAGRPARPRRTPSSNTLASDERAEADVKPEGRGPGARPAARRRSHRALRRQREPQDLARSRGSTRTRTPPRATRWACAGGCLQVLGAWDFTRKAVRRFVARCRSDPTHASEVALCPLRSSPVARAGARRHRRRRHHPSWLSDEGLAAYADAQKAGTAPC